MITVGIDQSLNNTGLTILRDDDSFSHFSIIPEKGMFGVHRTSFVSGEIKRILIENIKDEKRIIVCREGYSYGSVSSSIFNLGEMGGCIDMKLFESRNEHFKGEFRYYSIPPSSWKLLIFGAGSVKKDTQYLLTAYEKTGIKFPDDNIADSHMIAMGIKKFLIAPINSLAVKDKMGMISPKIRKKRRITDKNINKLTEQDFREHVDETLKEYLIFEFINDKKPRE